MRDIAFFVTGMSSLVLFTIPGWVVETGASEWWLAVPLFGMPALTWVAMKILDE